MIEIVLLIIIALIGFAFIATNKKIKSKDEVLADLEKQNEKNLAEAQKKTDQLVEKAKAKREAYEKLDEEGKATEDLKNAKNRAKNYLEEDSFEFILLEECEPGNPEYPLSFETYDEHDALALLLSFCALGEEELSVEVGERVFTIWDSTSISLERYLQYFSEEEKSRIWQTIEKYLQLAVDAKNKHGIDAFEDWVNKGVLNLFNEDACWDERIPTRFKAAMDAIKQEYPLSERQESVFDVIEFSG